MAVVVENAVTVGKRVSIVKFNALLWLAFVFPAASTTALGITHGLALPLLVSAVGVKTAVYVVPEPLRLPMVPLLALDGHRSMSANSKPVTASENVKVIVTV